MCDTLVVQCCKFIIRVFRSLAHAGRCMGYELPVELFSMVLLKKKKVNFLPVQIGLFNTEWLCICRHFKNNGTLVIFFPSNSIKKFIKLSWNKIRPLKLSNHATSIFRGQRIIKDGWDGIFGYLTWHKNYQSWKYILCFDTTNFFALGEALKKKVSKDPDRSLNFSIFRQQN